MATKPTATGARATVRDVGRRRIAFGRDQRVSKTTVGTLVAARLAERTPVRVIGTATKLLDDCGAGTDDALTIEWTVDDCPPSVETNEAPRTGHSAIGGEPGGR